MDKHKEIERMTDEEIERALKERAYDIYRTDKYQKDRLSQETLAYIDRLKEACQSAIQSFTKMETLYKVKCNELECAKQQAVREFAEKLKSEIKKNVPPSHNESQRIYNLALEDTLLLIDRFVKEVCGE